MPDAKRNPKTKPPVTATPARAKRAKRVRLAPEQRRSLILDHAADIVARDGVSALSMDSIGREAGISKALVYNYFPNTTELLRQLLQREWRRLRRLQVEAAREADTFEALVRSVTHVYLKYIDERGLLIERLQAEPAVSAIHDPTEFSRDSAVGYLADIVAGHFGLPADIAKAATDISFGLPAAAGVKPIGTSLPTRWPSSLMQSSTPSIARATSTRASIKGLPPSSAI